MPDSERYILQLKKQPEQYWIERGERRMLKLFWAMAERVPAYRDFLRKNSIDPRMIKTAADFKKLPLLTKENYLRAYPLDALTWDGALARRPHMYAATSGSTGEPFYFPRTKAQDRQFCFTLELLLRDFFMVDRRSTLFINCFALGIWIGGMYMYQALKYLVDRNRLPMSIITPGAYKEEAIKAVQRLGGQYDQIVIGGYAPLVKDLLDEGERFGLNWSDHYVRFFFAAEGFSEDFRDYVMKKSSLKNPFISAFNHYGTADMGTMAHETPLSIFLRRFAVEHEGLRSDLFNEPDKQPTLCQFIPEFFFFEEVDEGLVASSASGLPLIRYDLKDRGGIFSLSQVGQRMGESGFDWEYLIEHAGLRDYAWNLPFVYVYERRDLTVSIYSVNIYPESIRRSLEKSEFERLLTTKFTMRVAYDSEQNQRLEIHVELKPEALLGPDREERIRTVIVDQLNAENSEWRDFYADEGIRHKILPRIIAWPYQHPEHFRPGAKQKWVKK